MFVKNRGDTLSFYLYTKNKSGVLFNVDSVTVTVYDPAGSLIATPVAVNVGVGQYEVNYTLPADAAYGKWKVKAVAVSGSYQESESYPLEVVAI